MQTIIYHGASSSFIIQGKACQNTIKKSRLQQYLPKSGQKFELA